MTPGTAGTDAAATVMIVDDDPQVASLYADQLGGDYGVRVAHGGEEALDRVDDAVDVILLDRKMPDVPGDTVLDEIRARDLDCRVALVTAVAPDFDVIDMPFDAYLEKPVSKGELHDAVEALCVLGDFTDLHRELSSKRVRRNVLRVERDRMDRSERKAYERLVAEIEELEARVSRLEAELQDQPSHVVGVEQSIQAAK